MSSNLRWNSSVVGFEPPAGWIVIQGPAALLLSILCLSLSTAQLSGSWSMSCPQTSPKLPITRPKKGQKLWLHAGWQLLTFWKRELVSAGASGRGKREWRLYPLGTGKETKSRSFLWETKMCPVAALRDGRPQLLPAPLSCSRPPGHLHMQQSEWQGGISDPKSRSDQSRRSMTLNRS